MQVKAPLYLTHPKLTQLHTKLVSKENGLCEFEETIFHLQGGGQPNDKGYILANGIKFEI